MKFTVLSIFLFLIARWAVAEEFIVRETKQGKVRGRILQSQNVTVEEYRGIPFAEPPLGNLRFKPPLPRAPWDGVYEATGHGSVCPQPPVPGFPGVPLSAGIHHLNNTEDCLELNIWAPTPQASTKVPVYVWIHGGGFSLGSAAHELYNGLYFAAKSGLVVVSMNYRLGILGFLNTNTTEAPGNMGLLDQHLALKWVQENIEAFGGDPTAVTLAGISAGSISVHAHVLSPMSQGLYKRAIMMSGTANTAAFFDNVEEGLRKGKDVARLVNCSHADDDFMQNAEQIIGCMRSVSAEELMAAGLQVSAPKLFTFFPTYSDQFLPYSPTEAVQQGLFNNVDILAGITSDEGSLSLIFPKRSDFLEETTQIFDKDELKRSVYGTISSWLKTEVPEMLEYYESRAAVGNAEALVRAYIDYMSDGWFNCPDQFFAEKHSTRGNAVYRYIFGQKWRLWMLPDWMGAPHGMDLFYAFARPLAFENDFSEEDRAVSEHLVEAFTSFCKHGVPSLPNGNIWKQFTAETPVSIFIAHDNITEVREFRKEECERWRRFV